MVNILFKITFPLIVESSLVNGNIHPLESSDSRDADSYDGKEADDEWEQVGRNNKSANLRKVMISYLSLLWYT